jgi:hypothetical protein
MLIAHLQSVNLIEADVALKVVRALMFEVGTFANSWAANMQERIYSVSITHVPDRVA